MLAHIKINIKLVNGIFFIEKLRNLIGCKLNINILLSKVEEDLMIIKERAMGKIKLESG